MCIYVYFFITDTYTYRTDQKMCVTAKVVCFSHLPQSKFSKFFFSVFLDKISNVYIYHLLDTGGITASGTLIIHF